MSGKTANVLFLCSHNSARSIMAEVVLNHLGGGRFKGFSAGSQPVDEVNPITLKALKAAGLPIAGLRSKSWTEFATAPEMDYVFTVCDATHEETSPQWPGKPLTAHWSIKDPVAFVGTDDQKLACFTQVLNEMWTRIGAFIALPISGIERVVLQRAIRGIGQPSPQGR